eukprot:1152418-Rhodomonas_salina.1
MAGAGGGDLVALVLGGHAINVEAEPRAHFLLHPRRRLVLAHEPHHLDTMRSFTHSHPTLQSPARDRNSEQRGRSTLRTPQCPPT